jgi:hypothetical protein
MLKVHAFTLTLPLTTIWHLVVSNIRPRAKITMGRQAGGGQEWLAPRL